MRLRLLAVVLAAALAACFTQTEQQHKVLVVNESAIPLIVRFGPHGSVRVDPGGRGMGRNSFGLLHGPIVVMDGTCAVLQTIEAAPQQYGTVRIREDGSAVLEEGDPGAADFLEQTEACDAGRS